MARTLYISKKNADRAMLCLGNFPNFHSSGSIKGMKKQYYGKDALLIRSGIYIYNVNPETYEKAKNIIKFR